MKNLGLTIIVGFEDCSSSTLSSQFCEQIETVDNAVQSAQGIDIDTLLFAYSEEDPDVQAFSISPNQLPFAIIYDPVNDDVLNVIENATPNQISSALEIDYTDIEQGSGSGDNPNGGPLTFFSGDFDLFDIGLSKYIWAGLAIAGTYKTLDSKTKLGQIGFGTITGIAAIKYFKSK